MNHLPKLRVVTCSNSSETMFWCLDQVAADPRSTLLICPSEDIATRIRRYYKHSALNGNEESLIGWDTMVRSISTESARPKRSPIRAVQKRILQRLVNTELTSESYIKGLPWSPGLNSALLDLILELKANGVLPEYLNDTALEHRLDLDNPLLVKEISTLLSAYNSYLLAHGLYDSTEFLKRALSTNNDPVEFPLNGKLMIFCGHFSYDFEFFDSLVTLSKRGVSLTLTVPYALQQFPQLHQNLRLSLEKHFEVTFEEPSGQFRSTFYEPDAIVIDAPNRLIEVETVARQLCHLYHKENIPWQEMTIVVRDSGYIPYLDLVSNRYEIPFNNHFAVDISQNVRVKTVMTLLEMMSSGWSVAGFMEIIKGMATGVSPVLVSRVRKNIVQISPSFHVDFQLTFSGDLPAEIASKLELLKIGLRTFSHSDAPFSDFGSWLSGLIKSVYLANHKHGALSVAMNTLDELCRFDRMNNSPEISFQVFAKETTQAWKSLSWPQQQWPDGVLVLTPEDCDHLKSRVVVILGFDDRQYPRRQKEPPFLSEGSYRSLNAVYKTTLPLPSDSIEFDRFLAMRARECAEEKLIISHSRIHRDSESHVSSFLPELLSDLEEIGFIRKELNNALPLANEYQTPLETDLIDVVSNPLHVRSKTLPIRVSRDELLVEQPLAELTAIQIESYNRCPFHWNFYHRLKIIPTKRDSLDSIRRRIYHSIVKTVSVSPDIVDNNSIEYLVVGEIEKNLLLLTNFEVRILSESLTRMATEFIGRESAYRARFGISKSELDVPYKLTIDPRLPVVPGVIPRIDYLFGDVPSIFYARYSGFDWRHFAEGKSLHVMADALAASSLLNAPVGAIIFDDENLSHRRRFIRRSALASDQIRQLLPTAGLEAGPTVKPLSEDEWADARSSFVANLRSATTGIQSGNVGAKVNPYCQSCQFRNHCRMDSYGHFDGKQLEPAI